MSFYALVADVGGTNIRLAIANLTDLSMDHVQTYRCADFAKIDDAIEQYLSFIETEIHFACIDVACPVTGDKVDLTNNHWCFSQKKLAEKFGFEKLYVINDFTAIAMAIPSLSEEQKTKIGGKEPAEHKPIAIYGAGTGLGVAHLVYSGQKWIALGGEGGHADFAPTDAEQVAILEHLQHKYTTVSAEQLLSGLGLVQIYQALCSINNQPEQNFQPADITTHGINNTDEMAASAMRVFCRILGSFGGNLALTMATFGGVYIAGGIVPRFIEYLKVSEFRASFEAKGRFQPYVSGIPVYVVTEPQPGLLGCAAYLKQEL
ncbi:glucokinase [Psychrosphaera haliotis]|uniref:Glucokinase n=1 Tax=Psychrosphaera haliotis TaxID=555083 RepID=A0A6N8F359_9GAMM|nr:glucokinase [Psychrosphaera haliotis]MUH71096.1 glucokinase [Psychrosphaera haliotis]